MNREHGFKIGLIGLVLVIYLYLLGTREKAEMAVKKPDFEEIVLKIDSRGWWTYDSALMGSPISIHLDSDETSSREQISRVILSLRELERTVSSWRTGNDTALLARNAGSDQWVTIDSLTFDLIVQSKLWSVSTSGAFDITIGPVWDLYPFRNKELPMPEQRHIHAARKKVGSDKIQLNPPNQARLLQSGMKLNFGAIAKGYAVDLALRTIPENRVENTIVELGGTICVRTRDSQSVSVFHPSAPSHNLYRFHLNRGCVATSNLKKGLHILDPRTGEPSQSMSQVTVMASNATMADALSTAFMVMGMEESKEYLLKSSDPLQAVLLASDGSLSLPNLPPSTQFQLDHPLLAKAQVTAYSRLQSYKTTPNIDRTEVSNSDYITFSTLPPGSRDSWYPKNTPDSKVKIPRYYRDYRPLLFKQTEASRLAPFDEETFRKMDHPVVGVDFYDASAYCAYLGKRLPKVSEFENVSKGDQHRVWPWGNAFSYSHANTGGEKWGERDGFIYTAPVVSFPSGAGPFGHLHIAGNVEEWTAEGLLYGGGFRSNPSEVAVGKARSVPPSYRAMDAGFRCAREIE